MKNLLVISALGADKPGIVHELSKVILESGCNLEDSRMTTLGSEFGVIMLAAGKWNEIAKLESCLPALSRRMGLQLQSKRTEPPQRMASLLPYAIEVIALDQPGIVQQLAEFFARREINIRDLATARYSAVYTGTAMFSVQLLIDIPASVHIAHLRDDFMDFCDELNLDAIMEPVKG